MRTGHCLQAMHNQCPAEFGACTCACHPRPPEVDELERAGARYEGGKSDDLSRWERGSVAFPTFKAG